MKKLVVAVTIILVVVSVLSAINYSQNDTNPSTASDDESTIETTSSQEFQSIVIPEIEIPLVEDIEQTQDNFPNDCASVDSNKLGLINLNSATFFYSTEFNNSLMKNPNALVFCASETGSIENAVTKTQFGYITAYQTNVNTASFAEILAVIRSIR